jgi:hypothetical protein
MKVLGNKMSPYFFGLYWGLNSGPCILLHRHSTTWSMPPHLDKNIRENLDDLGCADDFLNTKLWSMKEITDKLDVIKIKNFWFLVGH